jgi:hypothetical protein
MARTLALLAAVSLATPASAQTPAGATLDSMALRGHTYFLAHDLLEGRGTGTRGSDVAALYLATAAARLGLHPAPGSADYFQPVPLIEAAIDTAGTSLTLVDSGGSSVFRTPAAFIPNAGTRSTLVDFGGEVAWVGSAADIVTHPDRLPPLSGRVAIMAGAFGADGAAADTLKRRGVTGVIHFVGDTATYGLYVHSRGPSRMYVADPSVPSSFSPDIPSVIARIDLIRRLLPASVTDEQLQRPFAIPGRRVQVTLRTRPRDVGARNVVAWLPGRDPARREEYVVYTAHYDHLGIDEPDARGDSIYNGFSDNAAGCAMLLAIAQYLAAHPTPRSALFIWFTGEERGLLGSDYYVANPVVPLAGAAGVINLDAGAPPARPRVWRISGADRSALGPLAIEVARAAGWEGQAAPASPNTDYFPFLRRGVPAVFLVPAPGAYEGLTTDSSQALRRRWDHYHEAADNWAADFPFEGLMRYADLALRLGLRLADGPRLPPAR